jgi:hypothetical protein
MYAKVVNGVAVKFPYTTSDLRKEHYNISFPKDISPELMADYGMVAVELGPRPKLGMFQRERRSSLPILVDGVWVLIYKIEEMFADEPCYTKVEQETAYKARLDAQAAGEMRSRRSTLIAETDWCALSDVVMSKEMAEYRKALRDISEHANWPHLCEDDWPVKP